MQEQFGYAYDKAWNLNERTNNALIQSFVVNGLNELSSASETGTVTVAGSTTETGNFVTGGIWVNGNAANEYGDGTFALRGFTPTNGQNTYTAVAEDNVSRFSTNSVTVNVLGSRSYLYDLNGNLTNDGVRNFAYDDENQSVSLWVSNAWSNSFAYDGTQRKRIEQEFAWNGSGWAMTNEVFYIYDGNLVLQERDTNFEPVTTYTRGIDLSGTLDGAGGIGGLLARSDNQKNVPAILDPATPNPQNLVNSYYFNDANGNVVAMVSPSGMFLAQYEYDPFGNLISKSGPMADINKYRFSSKEWDDNDGLYYYGYRFYDPNLQRWLNRDPIQEGGGINPFGFVDNGPLDLIDPFGLCNDADSLTSANSVPGGGPSPFSAMAEQLNDQLAQKNADAEAEYAYLNPPPPPPWPPYPSPAGLDDLSGDLFVAATMVASDGLSAPAFARNIGSKGLNYLNSAYDTGGRIASLYDPETGEMSFAATHDSAFDLMETATPKNGLVHGEYSPGIGWQTYTGNQAAQRAAVAAWRGQCP